MKKQIFVIMLTLIVSGLFVLNGCEEKETPNMKEEEAPNVSTLSVFDITSESAKGRGNVVEDGSSPVASRGIVWSTSENPTTGENDGKTEEGGGTGEFESNLTGLSSNTTYYVRAYATSSVGTSYGNEKQFSTLGEYSLTIEIEGEGTVDKEVVEKKSDIFEEGTVVKLTANPEEDWEFEKWQGDITGTENPIQITMDKEKKVTAVFKSIGIGIGKEKWKFETGDWITSAPAIGSDGTIYFGSHDYHLYAIGSSGSQKWKFETGGRITSAPTIDSDGTIYFGSSDNYFYAIGSSGSQKWKFETGGRVYSSCAIGSDGTIYVGSWDNYLYAINPDGSEKWNFYTRSYGCYPTIGSDGTIYAGSPDGKLYAINPDGSGKWEFEAGNKISTYPTIDSDGTIYVGSWDNYLYAINPDGSEKWKFRGGDYMASSPVIGSDGTIYAGCSDGKLYAINPDGSGKWEFETQGSISSAPIVDSEGTIYVGSWDNYLYAINPDGSEKWKFVTEKDIQSAPTIGSDGTVYIGSHDTYFYAIKIEGFLADTPWPMLQRDVRHTGREDN